MKVLESIIDYLRKELGDRLSKVKVSDVRIGLAYTGVSLTNKCAGVAYTFPTKDGCSILDYAGEISDRRVSELMEMALSQNLVEASIGVATINALSQMTFKVFPERYKPSRIDVLDLIRSRDRVLMIGYFAPLVPKILRKTRDLYLAEMRKISDKRIKLVPSSKVKDILSSSDVILISGSTLVNKTIDEILESIGEARESILLGPTASVIPHPLFKMGITAVMGIEITDPYMMLKVISEAGGTRQLLSKCARKIAFIRGK